MNLTESFKKAFKRKEECGWKNIYVFVDVHQTIFKSTYGKKEETFKYYPHAKNALKMLSKHDDIILGLSTSSYPADIAKYLEIFEDDDINFQLVNENHMEKNTNVACFDKKPYFNVLIDDKAGFDGGSDWYPILEYLRKK